MNEEELKKGCGRDLGMQYPEGGTKCGRKCYGCTSIHYCDFCRGRLEGFQKGKLEQKKEDIKLINNLKNPYPRDVFTEPSKEQWDKLQILFEDNNLTQDRYFGSFGRLVFNNIIKQLQKEIGGNGK